MIAEPPAEPILKRIESQGFNVKYYVNMYLNGNVIALRVLMICLSGQMLL
jgi:hypothetical protein